MSSADMLPLKVDDVNKLFTKDSKLKKNIGCAEKGWQLGGINGSNETTEKAIDAAKQRLNELLMAEDRTTVDHFYFFRRTGSGRLSVSQFSFVAYRFVKVCQCLLMF